MKDILVSIENDLPSSITLRYCCRLAGLIQARVQVIHSRAPGKDAPAIGAGWAQHAWREDLLTQARHEITQILRDDQIQGPVLLEPILEVGDREAQIMAELGRKPYALAAVGLPLPLTPDLLHKLFRLEVAHITSCPVLFGLTMAPPENVLFCLAEAKADSRRIANFLKLMEGAPVKLDLATGPNDGVISASPMSAQDRMDYAAKLFEASGIAVGQHRLLEGTAEQTSGIINQYGMVVPPLSRGTPKDSAWLAILSHSSTTILVC